MFRPPVSLLRLFPETLWPLSLAGDFCTLPLGLPADDWQRLFSYNLEAGGGQGGSLGLPGAAQ
ncbi:hypothetical protein ACVWZX_004871 [Deinococcus sp. UYEF24]